MKDTPEQEAADILDRLGGSYYWNATADEWVFTAYGPNVTPKWSFYIRDKDKSRVLPRAIEIMKSIESGLQQRHCDTCGYEGPDEVHAHRYPDGLYSTTFMCKGAAVLQLPEKREISANMKDIAKVIDDEATALYRKRTDLEVIEYMTAWEKGLLSGKISGMDRAVEIIRENLPDPTTPDRINQPEIGYITNIGAQPAQCEARGSCIALSEGIPCICRENGFL